MKVTNWNLRFGLLFTFLLTVLILLLLYKDAFIHPNKYLYAGDGDGMKSYYAYMYHIKHDTSYMNFEGMNYPYGENILFVDSQPFLINVIKAISKVIPGIIDYSIGIINFLLLFSLVICAVFIYLILLEFNLPPWYSVLGAISITLLSPQIFRIVGHLAMAYCCFIPMNWYFIIRFFKSDKKLKWTAFISLFTIIWFYTHAYMGMILVMFNLATWVFYMVFYFRSNYKKGISYLYIFIQALFPVILFSIILNLTDNHVGRPDQPWGVLSYTTNLNSIFVPHHPPFRSVVDKIVVVGRQPWEGWGYIGMASVILLSVLLIMLIIRLIQRRYKDIKNYMSDNFIVYFLSAILIVLFAHGFPFFFRNDFIDKLFKPLIQFRSQGRFVWVFYYVIMVYAVFVYYRVFQTLRNRRWTVLGFFLIGIVHFLYIWEGYYYHKNVSNHIQQKQNIFIEELLNNAMPYDQIKQEKYQAILTLPFHHIGSEAFSVIASAPILEMSYILSYKTGLPMFSSICSRTSSNESRNIVQLISPAYYEKLIKKDLPNQKPFLLFYSKQGISKYEEAIIKKANKNNENDHLALYELPFDSLFKNMSVEVINEFYIKAGNLFRVSDYYVNDTTYPFMVESFEDLPNQEISHTGHASYIGCCVKQHEIYSIEPGTLQKDVTYVLSIWNYYKESANGWIIVQETDEFGETTWNVSHSTTHSAAIDAEWAMTEFDFTIRSSSSTVKILFHLAHHKSDIKFYLDDLLIREKNTEVYKIIEYDINGAKSMYFNNNFLRKNKENNLRK